MNPYIVRAADGSLTQVEELSGALALAAEYSGIVYEPLARTAAQRVAAEPEVHCAAVDLCDLWDKYVVYAQSCVSAGVFPAPFGATAQEAELRRRVHDANRRA